MPAAFGCHRLVHWAAAHDLFVRIDCSVDKIKAAIKPEVQEKKLADYKKTLPPKPPSEGLLKWVKKAAWEKD